MEGYFIDFSKFTVNFGQIFTFFCLVVVIESLCSGNSGDLAHHSYYSERKKNRAFNVLYISPFLISPNFSSYIVIFLSSFTLMQ